MGYTPAVPYVPRGSSLVVSTVSRPQPLSGIITATPAAVAWPLANLAIYCPIYFNEDCTVYEVGVGTGINTGTNHDIGLYDMAGNKIQSTGAVARAASQWQATNWTDLVLARGWYYAALSTDGTNTYSGRSPAAALAQAIGVQEQTSAYTLPATATLGTATTRAFVPVIAFVTRSVTL